MFQTFIPAILQLYQTSHIKETSQMKERRQKLQVAGIAQLPVPVISTAMVAMEVTIDVVDVVEVAMVDVAHVVEVTVEVPLPHVDVVVVEINHAIMTINVPVTHVPVTHVDLVDVPDADMVEVDGEKVADKISFRK